MSVASVAQVVLLGAAAIAVGYAINVANGSLAPEAISALNVACGAALVVLALGPRSFPTRLGKNSTAWLTVFCVMGLAYQAGLLLVTPPLMYGRLRPTDFVVFIRAIAAAGVLSGALAFTPRGVRRLLFAGVIALHGAMGIWAIHASPEPHIDVFYFQRESCAALLKGVNPYAITFPNIYGDATAFYGASLSAHGKLQFGFVYPPLSLLLALPGHLLGDVRYSQLFAIEASAALMAFTREGPLGCLAAALFLLTPRCFFVLEQSWTEPYVVLLLAATVFVACRAPRALPYALGLLLCVKQYLVFAVAPSLLLLPWRDPRAAGAFAVKAALTAAAVTVPLALWNARAFWFDVVVLQTLQPFRSDALSYLAWFSRDRAVPLPTWACFVATGVATALCLWRLPRTPAGFAAAIAIVFLVFFATNKQAFANYYFFVVGAMCCAVAAQPTNTVARSWQDHAGG